MPFYLNSTPPPHLENGRAGPDLEGHFQLGYHGKTIRNYTPVENPSQPTKIKRRNQVTMSVGLWVTMDDYLSNVSPDTCANMLMVANQSLEDVLYM